MLHAELTKAGVTLFYLRQTGYPRLISVSADLNTAIGLDPAHNLGVRCKPKYSPS
jgi:hypothetical protein